MRSHLAVLVAIVIAAGAVVFAVSRLISFSSSEAPPQTIEVRRSAGVIVPAGSSWQP
jgi:hypothetical protein